MERGIEPAVRQLGAEPSTLAVTPFPSLREQIARESVPGSQRGHSRGGAGCFLWERGSLD